LLLGFPFQFILVGIMFKQRKKGVVFTDARIKLTTEVLQGIRLIKFYAWEVRILSLSSIFMLLHSGADRDTHDSV
jgi:hypothetical protein